MKPKLKIEKKTISLTILGVLVFSMFTMITQIPLISAPPSAQASITDIWTNKVTYNSSATAIINATVHNDGASTYNFSVRCVVTYAFDNTAKDETKYANIAGSSSQNVTFSFSTSGYDVVGFNATIFVKDQSNNVLDSDYTVFDVANDPTKVARYGYIVDYDLDNSTIAERVRTLATKYHVNFLKFYDWFKEYQNYTPTDASWVNPCGKTVYYNKIFKWIEEAHKWGIKCIAYVVGYSADETFYNSHQNWSFTDSGGTPYEFEAGNLTLMCVGDECPWSDYMIDQYNQSMQQFNWDGLDIDQYAYPTTAYNAYYGGGTTALDVSECWGNFTSRVSSALKAVDSLHVVIFNSVNEGKYREVTWLLDTAPNQDYTFVEMWEPKEYVRIGNILLDGRLWSGGKMGTVAVYPAMRPDVYRLVWAEALAHRGSITYSVQGEGVVGDVYIPQYPANTPEIDDATIDSVEFMILQEQYIYSDEVSMGNAFTLSSFPNDGEAVAYKWVNGTTNAALLLHMLNHDDQEIYWDRPSALPTTDPSVSVTAEIPSGYSVSKVRVVGPGAAEQNLSWTSSGSNISFTVSNLNYYKMVAVLLTRSSGSIATKEIAVISTTATSNDGTPDLLTDMGYTFDLYVDANISTLWTKISDYKAIIGGYGIIKDSSIIAGNFSSNTAKLDAWIYRGGAFINTGDWNGTPLSAGLQVTTNYDDGGSYTEREWMTFSDLDHPIAAFPNVLTQSSLDNWQWSTGAWFTSYSNYEAIATEDTGGNPVVIAREYGRGKIALTTLEAGIDPSASGNGHQCPTLIQNMLHWALRTEITNTNYGVAVVTADASDVLPNILSEPGYGLIYKFDLYNTGNISSLWNNLDDYKVIMLGCKATDDSTIRSSFQSNSDPLSGDNNYWKLAEWIYAGGTLATTGFLKSVPLPPHLAVKTQYDETSTLYERESFTTVNLDHLLVRFPRDSLSNNDSWNNWGWSTGTWFTSYPNYTTLVSVQGEPYNATFITELYGSGSIVLTTMEIAQSSHPHADPVYNMLWYGFMPHKTAVVKGCADDDIMDMLSWTKLDINVTDVYDGDDIETLLENRDDYGQILLGFNATGTATIRQNFTNYIDEVENWIWGGGILISMGDRAAIPLHEWLNVTTNFQETGSYTQYNTFKFNGSYPNQGRCAFSYPNQLSTSYFNNWGKTTGTYFKSWYSGSHGSPWNRGGGWFPVILENDTANNYPVLMVNMHARGRIVLTTLEIANKSHPKQEIFENLLEGSGVNPRNLTAPTLFLSNWDDMMLIWMNSTLAPGGTSNYGPRVAELRYDWAWGSNQLIDQSAFFRDETNSKKYNDAKQFDSNAYIEQDGRLISQFLSYSGSYPAINTTVTYVFPPNEHFYVAIFDFYNPGGSSVTYNMLEMIHPNNFKKADGWWDWVWYEAARTAVKFNLNSPGQPFMGLTILNNTAGLGYSYQAAKDGETNLGQSDCSPWIQFDSWGYLGNNVGAVGDPNVSGGLAVNFSVGAGSNVRLSFALAVGHDNDTSQALDKELDRARSKTPEQWLSIVASNYTDWLNSGNVTNFDDDELNLAFNRTLVVMKNVQQPQLGTFPAATNPSYNYKTWVRDASYAAISLDLARHTDEAAKYWKFMKDKQYSTGIWNTTYDMFTGDVVSFVEPEWDFVYPYGVYLHYLETQNMTWLNDMYDSVNKCANFFATHISSTYGLMGPDCSIWEETSEYNVFSQAAAVASLKAAAKIAEILGYNTDKVNYMSAAARITNAIQRSTTSNPPGLWNEEGGYYIRALTSGGAVNSKIDGSSLALFQFGVIDANSTRAQRHLAKVEEAIGHGVWGIARYEGDNYYYDSPWSPAGCESECPEPVWPALTFWFEMSKLLRKDNSTTMDRLCWYLNRTEVGYMGPGECISWVTGQPITSTAIEPMPCANFLWLAQYYLGQIPDPVLIEPYTDNTTRTSLSQYKTITVTAGAPSSDMAQWNSVNNASDNTGDCLSTNNMTDIKRVWVCNNSTFLFIRIDNVKGTLSGWEAEPGFAGIITIEDLASSSSQPTYDHAYYQRPSGSESAYAVGRWNNGSFSRFNTTGTSWSYVDSPSGACMEWNTNEGMIEMRVPLSCISSTGSVSAGKTVEIVIELAYHNQGYNLWFDDDLIFISYTIASA